MEVTVLSEQKKTAMELNEKIIITAQMAQKNLYDMCVMLKQMRDDKLYKELGYVSFEDYCENEVGMKHSNAYRFISIIEKVKNFPSMGNIGMTKLSLLASLSESQQEEIKRTVNLEETSVRELKAEIDMLKSDKKTVENALLAANSEKRNLRHQLSDATIKLADANEKIQELENRPIEVAVQQDPLAAETIKRLNRELSVADQDHANNLERQRKKYQEQINDLESQLEQAKNKATVKVKDSEGVFNAYFSVAKNAFDEMLDIVAEYDNKEFATKVREFIKEIAIELENIEEL